MKPSWILMATLTRGFIPTAVHTFIGHPAHGARCEVSNTNSSAERNCVKRECLNLSFCTPQSPESLENGGWLQQRLAVYDDLRYASQSLLKVALGLWPSWTVTIPFCLPPVYRNTSHTEAKLRWELTRYVSRLLSLRLGMQISVFFSCA